MNISLCKQFGALVPGTLTLLLWLWPTSAWSQSCDLVFPDALQAHGVDGRLDFSYNAALKNNADTEIAAFEVLTPNGGTPSCGSVHCTASGTPSLHIGNVVFPENASQVNVEVPTNGSSMIGGATNIFNEISLGSNASLVFGAHASGQYRINHLEMQSNTTVELAAGDYWINEISLASGVELKLSEGTGIVRFFVNDSISLESNAKINYVQSLQTQNPQRLFIYAQSEFAMAANSKVAALVFAGDTSRLYSNAHLHGALSAKSVTLNSGALIFAYETLEQSTLYGVLCDFDSQTDTDSDGLPDPVDDDIDGDGFSNDVESQAGSDPLNQLDTPTDENNNGIADILEGYVNACAASFENGLQINSSAGKIKFSSNSQLLNASRYELVSPEVVLPNSETNLSCEHSSCYASGTWNSPIAVPNFVTPTNGVSVNLGGQFTLGSDGNADYADVTVKSNGQLTFDASNGEYRIGSLDVKANAKIHMAPGDYWIGQLTLASGTELKIQGAGLVRIFTQDSFKVNSNARLNSANGAEGDASQLFIFGFTDIDLASNTTTSALLYSQNDTLVKSNAKIYGAIAAGGIDLASGVKIHFNSTATSGHDFGFLCDLDGDGIYDGLDEDADGDGFSNEVEEQAGSDPFSGDSVPANADSDGDGYADEDDAFPNDPNEWADLDNDGQGDNSDLDIDGDEFDNDVEIAAGTDPEDPNSYPDIVPPTIANLSPNGGTIEAAEFILNGSVTDPEQMLSGVDSVVVTSNRYPGAEFAATINESNFNIELPLKVELNEFTVTATDLSGNASSVQLTIDRISPPRFVNVTPANNSVITEDNIVIQGEVHTLLPLSDVRFYVNAWQITPNGTGTEGVYSFTLENIALEQGQNHFTLLTQTSDGNAQQSLNLTYTPENAENIPAPNIQLLSPANGSTLKAQEFRLAAFIQSDGGPLTVTLNGENLVIPDNQKTAYSLNQLLSFSPDLEELTAEIIATDKLGKSSSLQAHYFRDNTEPQIILANGILAVPDINSVSASPITLSGSVIDQALANFYINGQAVTLKPGAAPGIYDFSLKLALPGGQQTPVNIRASDFAGNIKNLEVIFNNIATNSIEALIPADNASFISTGNDDINLQVVARVGQLQSGETVTISLNGQSSLPLQLIGNLASGDISLPPETGNHTLHWQVKTASGVVVAETSRSVSVQSSAEVPLEILKVEPARNQPNVEPNASVEFYFNKEVALADIQVEVRETLHGYTYINQSAPGSDFTNTEGYVLEEVNRSRQIVNGSIDLLPGNTTLSFSPSEFYGYGASVSVQLNWQQQELFRSSFEVRPLPTFVNGFVRDQFGQPLENMHVELVEAELATNTNRDGAFSFGFGEVLEKPLTSGKYTLRINHGFRNPKFGTQSRSVLIEEKRQNRVGGISLQELDSATSFYQLSEGLRNSLNGGDLTVDLTNPKTKVYFPDGRGNGSVHIQFLPFEHLPVRAYGIAQPHWLYSLQPKGIDVDGVVGLEIKIPQLRGSYDYLSEEYKYVVLLGFDPDLNIMNPVGIGKIENYKVLSVTELNLESLDFIGYALVNPTLTETMEKVISGEMSLQRFKAEL